MRLQQNKNVEREKYEYVCNVLYCKFSDKPSPSIPTRCYDAKTEEVWIKCFWHVTVVLWLLWKKTALKNMQSDLLYTCILHSSWEQTNNLTDVLKDRKKEKKKVSRKEINPAATNSLKT